MVGIPAVVEQYSPCYCANMAQHTTLIALGLLLTACNSTGQAAPEAATASNAVAPLTASSTPPASAHATTDTANQFGKTIDKALPELTLSSIAQNPKAYATQAFVTAGTVTAVCQHRGCWLDLKDDKTEAHVRVPGHAFSIPKTAFGRKVRIMATVAPADAAASCNHKHGDKAHEGHGDKAHDDKTVSDDKSGKKEHCNHDGPTQADAPAKLQLEATGVELI